MIKEDHMKVFKRMLSFGTATLLVAAMPLQAMASPEFSRTEEEWARLQDDVIEYDELAGLINEYNATVQKNRIDMNEFRKEYGNSNEDVAKRYRELADEIERNISYPSNGDSGYATTIAAIIGSETQIDNYREMADDAVDDATIKYLTYQSAETALVSIAQSNMISYYNNQLQLQSSRLSRELQQENYQSAVTRKAAGTGTEVDVLNAQEALRTTDQAILQTESAMETGRQKLLVMLGWSHDANPQIGTLPEPDMNYIATINPTTDKAQALENNFTLRINKRKLENAKSSDTRETLETSIKENEQSIGASLTSSYQGVVSAKAAYDLAVAQSALEQQNFQTASRNYQLGTVSRLQYLTQKHTADQAQLKVQMEQLNLLQAAETYRWAVNGLASAS